MTKSVKLRLSSENVAEEEEVLEVSSHFYQKKKWDELFDNTL